MQHSPSRFSRLTVFQLIISLFGLASSLLSLFGMGLLAQLSHYSADFGQVDSTQFGPLYWLSGFLALLSIPSIVFSIRSLKGKSEPAAENSGLSFKRASVYLVLWVPALYLGVQMAGSTGRKTFLPLVAILIIVIPLIWLVEFGSRNLSAGGYKKFWGVVNGSIFFTLPVIFAIEAVLIIIVLLGAGIWLIQQPGLMQLLENLRDFSTFSPNDLQPLLQQMRGVVDTPTLFYFVILGFCVVVPIIEELFKPLMVWILAGRKPTPAEGFCTGLLCGAAFAMVESLSAILSVNGSLFLSTAAGRVGTGLLHTLNSGMVGWALASAWQDGKVFKLALTYLGAVFLHGIWNFFALLFGLNSTGLELGLKSSSLTQAAPWMLGLLGIWMLTMLFVMNQKLKPVNQTVQSEQPLPPPFDLPQNGEE